MKRGLAALMLTFLTAMLMTTTSVYGWDERHDDNNPNDNLEKWCNQSLKECARNIDDMNYKDGDIDFKHFKQLAAWKTADEDEKFCIVESADLGNNLATYEVMKCYKDPDYYLDR